VIVRFLFSQVKSERAGRLIAPRRRDGLAQLIRPSFFELAAKVVLTAASLGVHRLPHEQKGIYDDRGRARRSAIARRMA
jgi:hypothetical protein